MKLTSSQERFLNHMEQYNAIFAVLEYKGNLSNREYCKVRYCENGNLNKLFNNKVIPKSLLESWTEQGLLIKKEPYKKIGGKESGAIVTEYHKK